MKEYKRFDIEAERTLVSLVRGDERFNYYYDAKDEHKVAEMVEVLLKSKGWK